MEQRAAETNVLTVQHLKKLLPFSSGNYPYVCARVKAKRSLLLSKDIYTKLMVMDLPEITRFIGESNYRKEVTDLGLKYQGLELIELALNRNMAAVYHQILDFCEGDLYTMLAAYLRREDLWNIKTILRGKFYNAKPEDIMKTIVPAGAYNETYWRDIVQSTKNIDEVIETLRDNEYYAMLVKLKEKYGMNLTVFENDLDMEYYQSLLTSIRPNVKPNALFLDFIRREIDLVNLKTLFMTKFENVEPNQIITMLIPGGQMTEKGMLDLANAQDFLQFIHELQKFPWYTMIREKIENIPQSDTLNPAIRALEKQALVTATKSSYLYPLSILPILDYLIRKRIEVDNLRIIARGKDVGLPESVIRDMLVI